ncbi:MAG: GNAT family N-acetyltransferase [Jatrophihabitans sp.]
MGWTFTDDPERYAAQVVPLLTRRPAANTLPLTVLDTLRTGQRWSDGPIVLGWYTLDGEVTGAVSMTPPYGILLAELPEASEVDLVAELRALDVPVPDVAGADADVARFVACWTAGGGPGTEVIMRQRLYQLAELRPPQPAPAGSARPAGPGDLGLVLDWMLEFQQEAEPRAVAPSRPMYQRRIELGLLWLWMDAGGNPVSVAGRNATVAGTARLGPVYTTPRFRRRGYGAAATAACSQDALARGAEQVVLFTDLANPTSNAIYQRLGYLAVEDRLILRFID